MAFKKRIGEIRSSRNYHTKKFYRFWFPGMIHNIGVNHAVSQLSSEGAYFLYRGILPPLCQKTVALSLMFGVYEDCRRALVAARAPELAARTGAAVAAGAVEACIMPFERVQTLLQDHRFDRHFRNTVHTFRVVAADYGLSEFYRGFVPVLLRNCGASTVFFVARDEVKSLFPASGTWWGEISELFVSGAVIGAAASTIFYPFNVIKVHVQSKLGGKFESTIKFTIQMVREHGVRSLYRGVHLNYTRAFVSWGIINASYEYLKTVI
ncbi:mitochondrial nicotinamide adenine dinucleotide transporter SLC25A51 isoform X2 [Bacillus rossius redtenbacheri]|uniref:mitochondrial nicotinamide adenine dinucleotide transporter SLC25A51 isoform X2 n=1 Tax=Bacillus rossius redtenbacheri TaxID=93214 RepID=UPI002FDC9838